MERVRYVVRGFLGRLSDSFLRFERERVVSCGGAIADALETVADNRVGGLISIVAADVMAADCG